MGRRGAWQARGLFAYWFSSSCPAAAAEAVSCPAPAPTPDPGHCGTCGRVAVVCWIWRLIVNVHVPQSTHTHTHTYAYTGSGNWQQMITKLATKSGANLILMPSTTLSCCCGATLISLPQIRLAGAIWGLPFPLLLFFLLLLLVACAIWRLWAGLVTSSQDWDEGDDEEEETKLAKCLYNPELLTALTSIDFWRRQWWCALSGCCILLPHSCYLWIWNEISKVITVYRVLCLFTICEKTEKKKSAAQLFFDAWESL